MLKRKLSVAAAVGAGFLVSSVVVAQSYGPYTDPARMNFATQGCFTDQYQYDTYKDCYDAYYKSYPNKPFPDPE